MELRRTQPTVKGPADWFTGDVWIDAVTRGAQPAQPSVAVVHFTPGARTAWHSHDGGQTLHVTAGSGLVQSRGEPVVEVRAGDVVFTPDAEEHWHGGAPDRSMTHLSITSGDAHWGPHVTDEEYRARP